MTEARDRKRILHDLRSGGLTVDEAMAMLTGGRSEQGDTPTRAGAPDLTRRLEVWLADVVAAEAQVEVAPDRPEVPLERYGFDSVMALNVVRHLERHFGPLPMTLLFEHQTIAALARHLATRHVDAAAALLAPAAPAGATGARQSGTERPAAAPATGATGSGATGSGAGHVAEPVPRDGDIAVVALSGRFPMAADLDEFWAHLAAGRDCITEIPADRWDAGQDFDPEPGKPGRTYARWGGFIDDVDRFDASFFHISPREAERMDPQERLFLQEVWHALEDGAFTRDGLAGRRVGVYAGVMYSQYQLLQAEENLHGNPLYLGSSYASIANRVSYFFDLHGPSMAIDTMCSSSLTALHLACEALRRGEIELAITGGVNLSIHPNKYIDLSQGRYASTDGRCRSFGAGGDGYVPGEGVAVAVLRPLRDAVADGDRIHAVIRGTALGHGGKTNGYSVPNPAEQRRVIRDALAAASVELSDVSYVEAHGTGTALGDPIEIAALGEALGADPLARPVAVGSVKSNVGHLEAAAGIAGLIKVILQLRHRQLVPSLHAETLNPHIDFAGTSLRVQRELAEWRLTDGRTERIAGVSSFGAGGANAHVVVAEAPPAAALPTAPAGNGPDLLVLSAAAEERLRVLAARFADHLHSGPPAGVPEQAWFCDTAHTSRVGRQPLAERLALIADDHRSAAAALRRFAEGDLAAPVYRGSADSPTSARFHPDEVSAALAGRALERLARMWVGGAIVPWARLADASRRRVALPRYPFERQRHWPERVAGASPATTTPAMTVTAGDRLVREHRVGSRHLLPGAALIELMLDKRPAGRAGTVLTDVVFAAPVEPPAVGGIELVVEAVEEAPARLRVVGGSGSASATYATAVIGDGLPTPGTVINVSAVVERCDAVMPRAGCYERLAACGITYGPALQLVNQVYVGADEAVARLVPDRGAVSVMTAVLDAAFQTLVAFAGEGDPVTRVPFTAERLAVHADPDAAAWAYAVARRTGAQPGPAQVFDLQVLDDEGRCLVTVEGLVVRPVPEQAGQPVVLERYWTPAPAPAVEAGGPDGPLVLVDLGGDPDGRLAELLRRRCGSDLVTLRSAEEHPAGYTVLDVNDVGGWTAALPPATATTVIVVHGDANPPTTVQAVTDLLDRGFFASLTLGQALLRRSSSARHRLLSVHPATAAGCAPEHAAVAAVHRVAAKEHPAFSGTTLALESEPDGRIQWRDAHVDLLLRELAGTDSAEVRYVAGRREQLVLRELTPTPEVGEADPAARFRRGGVYLVTGGLGGLGRLVARHLLDRWDARLVLVGRSPLEGEGRRWLDGIVAEGRDVTYFSADVATHDGAHAAARWTRERHGRIDGVVHLAGVLRDGLIFNKRREDAELVLAPKVWAAYHLDQATQNDDLDIFLLFSSASAVVGVAGQVDYAYANDFLNGFAGWREHHVRSATRTGRTVAVAWPLWDAGGMDIDPRAKERIWQELGWLPLPAVDGLRLLDAATAGGPTERVVFYGHRERILRSVGTAAASGPEPAPSSVPAAADSGTVDSRTLDRVRAHLRQLLAAELRMPAGRLDPRRRFEQLGLESVMVMNLNRQLEPVFGALPKTMFFEFQTVDELARHLTEAYPDAAAAAFGHDDVAAARERGPAPARPANEPSVRHSRTSAPVPALAAPVAPTGEPIAIVGLAGRYPMADTVDELWQRLRDGTDCITEIPAERWDYTAFFDPTPSRVGHAYSKWGGFLRDVDGFDPRFFNISPREARQMDPQERLFLQTAWHTLDDAGYTRRSLAGRRVGVFAGVMYAQYQLYGAQPDMQRQGFVPASLSASVANRVSYVLGFRGPSLSLDTMCSSSLTALHYACASIRLGDCDEALAGGVNAILHPNRYLQLCQGRFASTDGRCRSFGAGGDGYVPGEGVGAVLLKPLRRAEADGDHIYGLIRATGVNHGGRTNGYTVPSPAAHADLITATLRRADVRPGDIDYIEAHGTGTALGDPIEIEGLVRSLTEPGSGPGRPRPIGSVKSNIGHLESAAGIAGLTKVLLQLRHRQLAPSLHAEPVNPDLRLDAGGFHVPRALQEWPQPEAGGSPRPRLATVSSFGAGGANASVVIEEYVPAPDRDRDVPDEPELIVVSARTDAQLREAAAALAARLVPRRPAAPGPAAVDGGVAQLRREVADILGVSATDIDPAVDLDTYGLDRVGRAHLVERIEARYGRSLPPGADVRASLRELADHLAAVVGPPPSAYAGELAGHCPDPDSAGDTAVADLRLRDVAYTLEHGREPMADRLAFVADDLPMAADLLRRFADGDLPDGVHRGRVADEPKPLADILSGPAGTSFVEGLRQQGERDKLAQLWAAGLDLPPVATRGRRVPLPGYPFARDRYWIPFVDVAAERATPPEPPAAGPAYLPQPPSSTADDHRAAGERPVATGVASRVHDTIVTVLSQVLEVPVEEFRADAPHGDFGVDSVLAVEIVDRINAVLGVELKPADFFNYATIRTLIEHVDTLLPADAVTPEVPAAAPARPAAAPEAPAPVTVRGRSPEPVPAGSTDIAVIGMSARFPGARDVEQLWAALVAGRDEVREIPPSRWDVARHFDADRHAVGKTYSRWGSVLEGIEEFDPDFFGISPREARLMDPQQRLLLMEAWRALESAGYADRDLDGIDCHCIVGTAMGDYHHLLRQHGVPLEGYTFTGTHPAVLASRTSYQLNLRGPSLAVDTSCSSSLMAVHLACEAIREGRAELAVAGGVAALFTPELHVLASKAGMLSPTGRCRAFDDAADGFVPGEGVGVVVLKGLAQALRDGDPIRGVIAGTGANQDGRTNGITAPSAPSQATLLTSVYERFGIDPDTIGYVECHGTGTRLGDPIEIEALTTAFRRHTSRTGYCAVGSIKSNLGHTLTAAGVAALIKALLCVERGRLVPSLHVAQTNRYIDFPRTPFYVNTDLREWPTQPGQPRVAAVSSFGFSGTNVHAVVRQWEPPAREPEPVGVTRLVPVSAKTDRALADRIADLEQWLSTSADGHDWRDIAYTLAAGRSHFPVRAVFLARDGGELLSALREWRRTGAVADPTDAPGTLRDACRAYLDGADIDWRALYAAGDRRPRRIPLPMYPFARDRYWVPAAASTDAAPPVETSTDPDAVTVVQHHLRPDQPLVRDHVVDGQPLLPAAGHVALVHRSLRQVIGEGPVTIHRAVWLRPVFVAEDRTVEVVLTPTAPGRYRFEVRSEDAGSPVVHSRGEASRRADEPDRTDLASVRGRCATVVGAAEHYARFDRIGVRYGPAFRSVQRIQVASDEALAVVEHTPDDAVVPAGLLDGAIQSVAALHAETPGQRPHVPFAMERVRVLRPVPSRAYAHIRQPNPGGECTVSIVDERGTACLVIDGLAYRELKAPVPLRHFTPQWRDLGAPPAGGDRLPERVAIVAGLHDHGLADLLTARHPGAAVHRLPDAAQVFRSGPPERIYFLGGLDTPETGDELPTIADLEHAQDTGVRALLRLVRDALAVGADDRPLEWFVVTANAHKLPEEAVHRPLAAGLFGFVRSLAKEQPRWRVRCVDIDLAELAASPEQLVDQVLAEPASECGDDVVIRADRRWGRRLVPAPVAATPGNPFRFGGNYLIIGGAGGIGAALGEHLARTVSANVMLVGRRPDGAAVQERIAAIEAAGGAACYVSADVTDEVSIAAAVRQATERFGPVHGVFHSALTLRDVRIEHMEPRLLDDVLAPKSHGALALARALRDHRPDFVAFFSSAQSFSGNAGQANYAAACTAKDALAHWLAERGVPVRILNWGYWGDVGVVAKSAYRRRMRSVGVHSISVAEGMLALEAALAGDLRQVMPLKAEPGVLERFGVDSAVPESADSGTPAPTGRELRPARDWDPTAGRALPPGPDGDELLDAHAELGALGARLAVRALQELGAFVRPGERRAVDRLADELGIAAAHRRLFATLLDVLVAGGWLRRDGDHLWRPADGASHEVDPLAEGHRLRRERPAVAAHVDLLEACLARYPEVLRGHVSSTEVMFPNGSTALAEGVYRGDPLSDRLNDVVVAAVTAYLDERGSARVLEIGAGTGATSGPVLAAIAAHGARVEYVYTDVSVGFLRHGRRTFGSNRPWLTFTPLDIEREPAGQGFLPGSFDLVIAANVLHATRDLAETLRHVTWLLAPTGRLVVSETTAFSVFATLTFGMLDGWWRSVDPGRRLPGSPLADVDTWRALLADAGLGRAAVLSPAHVRRGEIGQQVLVADATDAVPSRAVPGVFEEDVAEQLGELIAAALGRSRNDLDPDRPFTEYGVDSIVQVELVNAINKRLDIALRSTALFDHPTLNALARAVCAEWGDRLSPAADVTGREAIAAPQAGDDPTLALLERLAAGELTADETYARLETP